MYTCDQYFALLQYRSIFFFFKLFGALLSLHSFPTRRSSDLLDLEPVARVVEPADSLEQAARDVTLVVEGRLDGHRRPLGRWLRGHRASGAPTVPPVDREQEIGVQAIEKEHDYRNGVEDPDGDDHSDV